MKLRKPTGNNFIGSLGMLKGNTRISVLCEPLWGVPFVLYNFYLSLYMKELGVTDRQLGYIISVGYVSGTIFSLISGMVVDRLGRKRTTLIFDLVSWPLAIFVYMVSDSFFMFAAATLLNNFVKIVSVSWNLMVVEDASNEERIAAFNLLNIINISSGVIIPLAGILVGAYGIITAERIFLAFAMVSMTAMILIRNHFYRETSVGLRILSDRKKNPLPFKFTDFLPLKAAGEILKNPAAIAAAIVYVLFFVYLPLGTFNSLYFAPFMTEVLELDKTSISLLGAVYSGVMLFVFVFIIPPISKRNNARIMQFGLLVQAASLFALVLLPAGKLWPVAICIGVYSAGFGIFRPFLDTMLAGVTEGNERAGIYSLINTVTCIAVALLGFFTGSAYLLNPRLLYISSILILGASVVLLETTARNNSAGLKK